MISVINSDQVMDGIIW